MTKGGDRPWTGGPYGLLRLGKAEKALFLSKLSGLVHGSFGLFSGPALDCSLAVPTAYFFYNRVSASSSAAHFVLGF